MSPSLARTPARRPTPQRYRVTSGRGTHAAGAGFSNAVVLSGVIATTAITYTFNQEVNLQTGFIPQFITDVPTSVPVSAVQNSPLTITITYTTDQALGTLVAIPDKDPAIRTPSGGWAIALNSPIS